MEYKDTLNLPRTDFPMKANLAQKEPETLKIWNEIDLYKSIIEQNKDKPAYVMHDGPPYANGHIHHGHILNKVLKDIVIKYRNMSGFKCEYLPGWDCHGLPIEHQVDKELGKKKAQMSKADIRKECRKYAQKFIDIQREEFKRFGILGLWDKPYMTMDYKYEARIAREFAKIVGENYTYKKRKPVHWCISCETALAEAEVEYEDHSSPSIYVAFPAHSDLSKLNIPGAKNENTFMMIWTTTPWTIPANLAIALNPEFEYSVVEYKGSFYILATKLLDMVTKEIGWVDTKVVKTLHADDLLGLEFKHPYYDRTSKVVHADYVTSETGTGAVHTAPGHGQDDFETGLKYGLDVYSPVNDRGLFDDTVGEFSGEHVFKANPKIIEKLKGLGLLLGQKELKHSYPHCWRCKKPVIFRATEQWFISVENNALRRKALEEIDKVTWIPKWGRERIYGMVEQRPDWCVSRQRVWGNPIMSLRCKDCEKSFLSKEVIEHVADQVEKESTDIWFEKDLWELIPKDTKCPECSGKNIEKEYDILDVWFDSGVSHAAVLEEKGLGWPSDLYLEGSDQHRGWFQSSLLESLMTRGKAPFKKVLTHGFVVDGKGKKMSKSLGNFIPPDKILNKNGADILRMWVAAEDYRYDIRLSEEILKTMVESYRKIRNTHRFMLSNLYDFDPDKDMVEYKDLLEIDKWALDRGQRLIKREIKAYEDFDFHVLYHQLQHHCVVDLSNTYLDIIKDRLYTSKKDSLKRRSAQTVLFHFVHDDARLTAPMLSYTAEEVYRHLPDFKDKKDSVHMCEFPKPREEWIDDRLHERWNRFLEMRSEIMKALEIQRAERKIGHSLDANVEIYAKPKDMDFLKSFGSDLKYYFIVSGVSFTDKEPEGDMIHKSLTWPGLVVSVKKAQGGKCPRCWNYSVDVGKDKKHPELCGRCAGEL